MSREFPVKEILGIPFADLSAEDALAYCKSKLFTHDAVAIYTPNAEIAQLCREDPTYCAVICGGDLLLPDGAGVILASRILKTPLKYGKIAGVEFGEAVVKMAGETGAGVYFLGGKQGVAEFAAANMKRKYPELTVCGTHDGYFSDDGEMCGKIRESGAEIVFVCLGAPKQERWIAENGRGTGASLLLALGGSIDVYAGTVSRAPRFFRATNTEWLYRLVLSPKRFKRMLKIPKYLMATINSHK